MLLLGTTESSWRRGYSQFGFLAALKLPVKLTKEWIDCFNEIGESLSLLDVFISLNNETWHYFKQIESWFVTQPEKYSGLINLILGFSGPGNVSSIPKEYLSFEQFGETSQAIAAGLIRISQTDCELDE